MKIGSLLRAAVIISIGLAAILSWILFSTFEQVNQATNRGTIADGIVQGTLNQSLLASDYLLHREERARTLWSAKHESLTELVRQAEQEFKGSKVQAILDTIRENHVNSQAIFSELITTFEMEASGSEEDAKSQALEAGLTAQLLLKSQEMVSAASQLAETSRTEIETAQKRAAVFVVAFLVIMAVFGIAMLMLLNRKVLKPITQLQRGAEIIGEGDLDYRTSIASRDEIGGLSRAFDQMTGNLKAITASREELEREVTERRRVEEALRESNQTLGALIQASPLGIIAHDGDAQVQMWNPAAERIFGWSEREVLGRPYPLVPEERLDEFRLNLERSLRGEALTGLETRRQRKDGTQIDVGIWTGPLSDGGAMVVIEDITQSKQAQQALRESEEKFHKIFDHSNDAIILIDPERDKILDVNSKACDMLGFSPQELSSLSMSAIHPDEMPELRAFAQSVFEIGQGWTNELSCRTKTGAALQAEISASTVEIGGETRMISLVRDTTERKRAEETLLQQMRELAIVEERNRLAREIHDTLAQGLTAILWQLNAAERAVEVGGQEALEYLERVRSLAREGLQEARRSVWDLRAGPLEGRTLAEALEQETKSAAGGGDVKTAFVLSGAEKVLPPGVEAVLLRICQEALTNVLKYAKATQLFVTLAFDESQVRLAVQDNGIGFDPEIPATRGQNSGGFGLINMRERARLVGGELTVHSDTGQGTIVEATLSL